MEELLRRDSIVAGLGRGAAGWLAESWRIVWRGGRRFCLEGFGVVDWVWKIGWDWMSWRFVDCFWGIF